MRQTARRRKYQIACVETYVLEQAGYTRQEIANKLGLNINTVGTRIHEQERLLQKSAQHRLRVDAANAPQAGALCPHCGNPIILVAPETPRQ